MWGATLGLPEQVAAAAAAAAGVTVPGAVGHVAVCGMGGSGIAGDVLAAVAAPQMAVPVTVVKGYEVPASVATGTLCLCVSFSGDTEETASAAEAAAAQGARVVAFTGGGALGALADERGWPVVPVAPGIPQPRAALGALAVPPLVVLQSAGLLGGVDDQVAATVAQLERRRDGLDGPDDPARRAAEAIGRTFALVHGSGPGAVAAQRWKTQINENAKAPAFWAALPELCHNELAGWGQHGDVTRQVITLVTLAHPGEHPQVARRRRLVTEILREVVAGVVEVEGAGDGPLAQLFDLAFVGDVASLYLAAAEGLDPGPVPVLGELKDALRH